MPMDDRPNTASTPRQRTIHLSFTPGEADDILADLPGGQSVSEATRRLHQKLRDARRREPSPPLHVPSQGPHDMVLPAQLVRQPPQDLPVLGWILRRHDVTGISGTGVIGMYVVAPDGAAAYRWFGGPPQGQPKWEFYDNPGTAPFEQISGHNGNTQLVQVFPDEEV